MRSVCPQKGFSVLEAVIYIGLVVVILAVGSSSIISMYHMFGVLRAERAVSLNGDIAMETMIRDIRKATSTNISVSIFKQNPGTLKVGTTTFSLNGAVLQRQVDPNLAQAITGGNVRVTDLVFYRDTSPVSEIIGIRMTVESGDGAFIRQKKYYGSAVLRGSYK